MSENGSILLISDVHADIVALEAILRVAGSSAFREQFGPCGRIVSLGDVVERGHSPCEVIGRMKSLSGLTSIRGNHDEAFVWDTPISGSDAVSAAAHRDCREQGDWMDFFCGMETFSLDRQERLYLVHGGPIDPESIDSKGTDDLETWLHSRTWQRISREGKRYLDSTGYHYLPQDAFDAVRPALGSGFAIVCGHEHTEAAFVERGGQVEDVLFGLEKRSFEVQGRKIEEKKIVMAEDENYLVRLGIAGPGGYYHRYGWDKCYFGVYYRENGRRCISMLSFVLGRDTLPP